MKLHEERLILDGRQVRFFRQGEGPPLILVHGIGASAEWWLPNFEGFAAAHTTLAMDLPGCGQSGPLTDGDLARPEVFLGRFLEALGITNAAVIGHSMGGYVAARYAVKHPEAVNHLALVGSAGFGKLSFPWPLLTIPMLGELLSVFWKEWIALSTQALFYDKRKAPPALVQVAQRYASRKNFTSDFLKILRTGVSFAGAWKREELIGPLLRSGVPLLVVWGAQDPLFPIEVARNLRRLLPRAEFHIFDRCGHLPQLEHPCEFVEISSRFMSHSRV